MSIKTIRSKTGLSQHDFAKHYEIPLQTLKQWESAPESTCHRTPPAYVLHMLDRIVQIEYPEVRDELEPAAAEHSGQQGRLKAYAHLLRAAEDSRENAGLWFRYLRKEFDGAECRIKPQYLNSLIHCQSLSMFQRVTLKQAAKSGTVTNRYIGSLNLRASTPIMDELRRRHDHAGK